MGFLDSEGLRYLVGKIRAAIPSKTSQLSNDSGFLTAHQDISGKLDKTATAAAATKLATSRTIRTNLASTSTASFNGTANVTPGVTGVLPVANGGTGSAVEKYLPLAGGTLTGDLRIKGSSNYGTKINLGDGDYVHISEPTDDCLEIKAKKVNFVLSDTSSSNITVNSSPLGGGLTLAADFTLAAGGNKSISVESSAIYLITVCNDGNNARVFCARDMESNTYYSIMGYYELKSERIRYESTLDLKRVSDTQFSFSNYDEYWSQRILVYKLS